MLAFLKTVHVACAVITISGFVLRGYWMLSGSGLLSRRITRIAPHVIDTVFLASGIALVFELSSELFLSPWLMAKFAGLIVYIVLGTFALRRGSTPQVRLLSFVGALSAYAYIVGVALSKSPASWLAYLQ